MLILDLSAFLGSCLALILIGNLLVQTLSYLARFLKLSEFILGFILMAFSTTLPELSVAINAAITNAPGLALGNSIGSNIVNITLIAGIAACLGRKLSIKGTLIIKDAYWMLFLSTLSLLLVYLGDSLSRLDGIILICAYVLYLTFMIKRRNNYAKPAIVEPVKKWKVLTSTIGFLVLLPLLYLTAHYVVTTATTLSLELALPPLFIGLFFIAIGTSLPELAFSSIAALKRHPGLSLGNLIGANVHNMTLVLGIAAIITPISGNVMLFLTSSLYLLLVSFVFAIFIETSKGISWKEGLCLIFFYIFFIMIEFTVKGYFVNETILP